MRTALLDESGQPKYTNRLINESSPYLIQHAHNPVDWYPWGEEAFEQARTKDKPVFLSIGYSTCHWCHVMERESFDNESIAQYLNDHFIAIKLDREERPDLDDIYMTGVQLLAGQGGWPMSNFITHEGKPFFAGTYYPPAGFTSLLMRIWSVWQSRRNEILVQAEQIATAIQQHTAAKAKFTNLSKQLIQRASATLLERFDEINGGFGGAPKFPNESQLLSVLEDYTRYANTHAREALVLTLDKMYQGGIYDQIAGGFHRYAVDAVWLVPHFEKMLYNQAQLLRVYCAAYRATDIAAYQRVAIQIADYVLRDMTRPDGCYYSATDADSEGREGKFFVWQLAELQDLLNPDDLALVASLYGVTFEGNFESTNILNLSGSLEEFAQTHHYSLTDLLTRIATIQQILYTAREQREHPFRDEKVITAWNAMMVTALLHAADKLGVADYLNQAVKAAEQLWRLSYEPNVCLWRVMLDKQRSIMGNLEDYAYLAEALLTLYFYTEEIQWLQRSKQLVADMLAYFWDEDAGGFFCSAANEAIGPMLTRPKSPMDGAMPSGNSVALNVLVMLWEVTADHQYATYMHQTLNCFSGLIETSPSAFAYMLLGAERFNQGNRENVQFCADGKVRVSARRLGTKTEVQIHIAPDWHINSDQPLDSNLIATQVNTDLVVQYPEPQTLEVQFQHSPLLVYQGDITLTIMGSLKRLALVLQACNQHHCLQPETLNLQL